MSELTFYKVLSEVDSDIFTSGRGERDGFRESLFSNYKCASNDNEKKYQKKNLRFHLTHSIISAL